MGGGVLRPIIHAALLLGSYAAILGTLLAAAGSHVAVYVAVPGWAVTTACVVAARRAWPDEPLRRILPFWAGAATLSLGALSAAWLLSYGVQISAGLCGEGSSSAIALVVGAIVYAAAGAVLARNTRALLWAWPVAVVAGVAARLLLVALLPGAHGYCET